MLRHYDETGLLKPAQTDRFTNYRLYSADQIPVLNKIIFLRDLGFTVSEITAALDHWDDEYITGLLNQKRLEIEQRIETERDKLAKIELAEKDLLRTNMAIHAGFTIKAIPSYQVLSLRRKMPDYFHEGLLWKELSAFVQKNNILISDNTLTIYHDPDYRETGVDMEICVSVPHVGENTDGFIYRHTEAVPIMACSMVHGPFENIGASYHAFAAWLQKHDKYQMGDTSRQIVHVGPADEEDCEKFLTEIQIPLEIRNLIK